VLAQLQKAIRSLDDELADADPDLVTTAQAADIVEAASQLVRRAQAVQILYTPRAAQSTRWADEGHKNAAAWLAGTTQGSVGDAMATLETSQALEVLPRTTEALRAGELSFDQVKEIAGAARARPAAEADLLSVAEKKNLKTLKEACVRERARAASAAEENERYRKIHQARYVRHWNDADGAFHLDARLTPDAGAKVLSSLQPEADRIFTEARRRGDREPSAAYLADALVACVSGEASGPGTNGSSPRGVVHIRVDAFALQRGHVEGDEICEIPGVGPVPVSVARRQLSDAAIKYFAVNGKDILSVCHVGRHVTAHVNSALEERDPVCVVPGCGVGQGLERHHWDVEYNDCHTTSYAGLARVCGFHHHLLTHDGYKLTGGPGHWEMRGPPDAELVDTS
jgi:hypothetical protein